MYIFAEKSAGGKTDETSGGGNVGMIVGVVIAVIVILALVVVVAYFVKRFVKLCSCKQFKKNFQFEFYLSAGIYYEQRNTKMK